MAIEMPGVSLLTDEEGFLRNPDAWTQDVAVALANDEGIDMTETHWGLVNYFREFFAENQVHPTMNSLLRNMQTHLGKSFREEKAYVKYLYQLFPNDPIRQLCKIAGLPKPLPTEHDG